MMKIQHLTIARYFLNGSAGDVNVSCLQSTITYKLVNNQTTKSRVYILHRNVLTGSFN